MDATVGALAESVGGDVMGAADQPVTEAVALKDSGPGSIAFLADATRITELNHCQAGAVLIGRGRVDELSPESRGRFTLILVDDPQSAFLEILQRFKPRRERPCTGISPQALVAESAQIGEDTNIRPGATIEDDVVIGQRCDIHAGVVIGAGTTIGDDVVIHPNVVVYAETEIGNRVLIHSGTVIGADGFGFRFKDGRYEKVPHLGNVRIEDDVEVGAGTTIDRGTIGATVIGEGTKIDDQVMVAHNCEIGRHNALAAQVVFGGSSTTGDFVRCGGQAGVSDHLTLGEGASVVAKSVVTKNIPAGETWAGNLARPADVAFKIMIAQGKLPELPGRVRALEKQVAKLMEELTSLRAARDKAA